MKGFQKIAVAAAVATFLLIAVGGFVRAAGAGLGCPDWPHCFGRWLPPTDASQLPPDIDPARFSFARAWIEYANRLVGVAVGFLILAVAVRAWQVHRRRPAILRPAVGAVLLVAFQGWFGGQVVAHQLDPRLVSVHLLVALAIAALLLHLAVESYALDGRAPCPLPGADVAVARWLAATALGAVAVQVVLGALLRGSLELVLAAPDAVPRSLALGRVGTVDEVHKGWAAVVLLLCAGLGVAARVRLGATPLLRRLAQAPVWLAATQFALGLGLASRALPPALQLAHLVVGSLLFGVLVLAGLLLSPRRQPRASP